jgi:hypothetical protein
MSEDMLERLRSVDPAALAQVVRQDQRSETFEILDWTVKRLSDKGIVNPDGLFLFSGAGRDEKSTRHWSVVLKILNKPAVEQDPRHLRYWKRELSAMQSGLLASLPGPVAAPRCFGTSEGEGSGWIWMEHIAESTNARWGVDQYVFAAQQLGHFNSAYVTGTPLPDYSWLCKGHVRTKVGTLPPHRAWDSPFVQQAFSGHTRERILQLWDERERFYDALERLPQIFSHFDFHRRNLIVRQHEAGQDEIVAVDWAWCGYGALGADLYSLVGGSALVFEIEPTEVAEIEAAASTAYLASLRRAGWTGSPEGVRLGYTICFAMFLAAAAPTVTAYVTTDHMDAFVTHQFGRSREQIASGWAALCELALDRADDARQLMDGLGF